MAGVLIGALMREAGEFGLDINIETDEDGAYYPWFTVTGRSGETLVVTVTSLAV